MCPPFVSYQSSTGCDICLCVIYPVFFACKIIPTLYAKHRRGKLQSVVTSIGGHSCRLKRFRGKDDEINILSCETEPFLSLSQVYVFEALFTNQSYDV